MSPDRSSSRALLGLGIAVIVIAILGFAFYRGRTAMAPSAVPQAPGTAPATGPATAPSAAAGAAAATAPIEFVNDRLRREIMTQGLTVDRARQLFALEIGPLPGVALPDGPQRPAISGTYALAQILAVKDQLTPEQRAVLSEFLDTTHSAIPKNLAPLPQPSPSSPVPPFQWPAPRPAWYRADPGRAPRFLTIADNNPNADPAPEIHAYFRQLYHWANDAVHMLTGRPPVPAFKIAFKDLEGTDKTSWIATWTWQDNARVRAEVNGVEVNGCNSDIDLRKFQQQPFEVYLSVVSHEVVHCYQQLASASQSNVQSTAAWLHEGEATWAQMVMVPGAAFTSLQTHWADYLTRPKGHLYDCSYDAAGFFGHVADVEGSETLGKRIIDAFVDGAHGANDAAYLKAVAGYEDIVLDTWAPSYFRSHEHQFLWTAKGPGVANFPAEKVAPEAVTVAAKDTKIFSTDVPWEQRLLTVDTPAEILIVLNHEGHVALIDFTEQVNKRLVPFNPVILCVHGDCKCPPDADGTAPEALPALNKIDIGLSAGRARTTMSVSAKSLDEFCHPKDPLLTLGPAPSPRGGGGDPGQERENGRVGSDPHLVTFDGRYYDLQAIGEFVLARASDPADDFAVHVRFGPIGALRTVSVATAMATRAGRDRVSVTVEPGTAGAVPVLHINGARATQDFVPLDGGSVRAVFNSDGTGYVIELSDHTRVGITPFARQGLNVWMVPSPARKGKLTGLLGDGDDNAANDPVVRGTLTVLPASPGYDDLYTTFANSWRVTQQESLLDYGPGQTTATFTDPAFPDRATPAAEPAALAAAEGACKAGGITTLALLRNCAFDLAATGNQRYVRAYRPQQQRGDYLAAIAGLRGTGVVTALTTLGRTKSVVLEGRVTDGANDAFATFQGFKGDVVYLDPSACEKPRTMGCLRPTAR